MSEELRDRVGQLEGRVSTFETRLEATTTAQDRIERRMDEHHSEQMAAIKSLETAQAQRDGAREAAATFWRRTAIVATVLGVLIALGVVGKIDNSGRAAQADRQTGETDGKPRHQ